MQFSCNRKELLAAAKRTAKAASISTKVSVLTGMLIQADADNYELTLTATNMEIAISCTVPDVYKRQGQFRMVFDIFKHRLSLYLPAVINGTALDRFDDIGDHLCFREGSEGCLLYTSRCV